MANPEAARQLLVRSWMTHDAMWLRHCIDECGVEVANRINLGAVRSMAAIEVRRLQKLLGVTTVGSLDELRAFIEGAWAIIGGDFMQFEIAFEAPDRLRWRAPRCFAFEGVTQLGIADRYTCGILPRIERWLDGLGVGWTVAPARGDCMMQRQGRCEQEYRLTFPPRPPGG